MKAGDVVRLKSGGPLMTVGGPLMAPGTKGMITCTWFVNGKPETALFHEAALILAVEAKP